MDGYIHVAISNGVVSHVVRYDESMGDLVDPGSIYLARFRGILYPKFRISRRVIRNVASLIANRLFGGVVQLRYKDGDPLNLVSHNLVPIYPKRMEESIGDFQIIGRSGSKYKLRCAQCGYLRSSVASNAHKFSRCSRCARGRGRILDALEPVTTDSQSKTSDISSGIPTGVSTALVIGCISRISWLRSLGSS